MNKIIVDKNTKINTIQKGLQLLKENEDNEIFINSGTYFEKIKIKNSSHKLLIKGTKDTIISYNDHALKIHQDGKEFNTFRTYTMMILGDNVTLEDLTIINSSGPGNIYGQAVALSLIGNNIKINNCILKAYQDTIFLGPLPKDLIERYQNFLPSDELIFPKEHKVEINNTYIEGDVDFVFGSAEAYFNNCTFKSLSRSGFVFAPSTDINDEIGFVVSNSKFIADNDIPNHFIARPWRDYGYLKLINCEMSNHIYDEGFDKWNDTNRDKTCRFIEINTSYKDNHQYKRVYFVKTEIK